MYTLRLRSGWYTPDFRRSHRWHISICFIVAPRFVSRCRRNNKLQMSVASRRKLDSHRLLLRIACLPGLIKGSKELEITGPRLQTRPVPGFGVTTGSLWTILPTVPFSPPVISISVKTQQTPGSRGTWSRCRCEEGCHTLPTEGHFSHMGWVGITTLLGAPFK